MSASKTVRYVVLSQVSLYGFLFVCTVLMPGFLFERNEGGASNYGVHALTVVPYTLAFGLGGGLLLLAAHSVPTDRAISRKLQRALTAVGLLLLVVLLTTYPYKLNKPFDNVHIVAANLLFIAELAVSIWVTWRVQRDTLNIALFSLQTLGSAAALFTLLGYLHVLLVAQVTTGLALAGIMKRGTAYIMEPVTPQSRTFRATSCV